MSNEPVPTHEELVTIIPELESRQEEPESTTDTFPEEDSELEIEAEPFSKIEDFEFLKKTKFFASPIDHPKHGKVLAVAYFKVTKGEHQWHLNCKIGDHDFFDAPYVAKFERRSSQGRFVVKLIEWEEGLEVRRWGRNRNNHRDEPKFALRFQLDDTEIRQVGVVRLEPRR